MQVYRDNVKAKRPTSATYFRQVARAMPRRPGTINQDVPEVSHMAKQMFCTICGFAPYAPLGFMTLSLVTSHQVQMIIIMHVD